MKITVPLVRDVVMLALGAGGLTRELFLIGDRTPDRFRVGLCLALLMGPTFILGIWQAWLAMRQQRPGAPAPSGTTAGPMADSRDPTPTAGP